MGLKGTIQPAHIPVNNFELVVVGLPKLVLAQVSGLEVETDSVEMPDRTVASGGNQKASEFTIMSFSHHTLERAALESWMAEGKDPVTATYKKVANLVERNIEGIVVKTTTLIGLWIKKKKEPDKDMANEGDPAMIEWTCSADDAFPI